MSLISICIPAYKRIDYLNRLLQSIAIQTFKDFEVVISDDSTDSSVEILLYNFKDIFPIVYQKNNEPLGTPENWNLAVSKATGQWIKIMHDDDWFASSDALSQFAVAIIKNPKCDFFFSAYTNKYEKVNVGVDVFLSKFWKKALKFEPEILIAKNVIGPPSVTLYRKNGFFYDSGMKYIVDIDFYTRYISNHDWSYIDKPLINVGIHSEQVTKYTHRKKEYELKESLLMLIKKDQNIFKNPIVFDGWWRMIRNFEISDLNELKQLANIKNNESVLNLIISWQKGLPVSFLKIGIISKSVMGGCYLFYIFFKK